MDIKIIEVEKANLFMLRLHKNQKRIKKAELHQILKDRGYMPIFKAEH